MMPYRERLNHHWNHIIEKAHTNWGYLIDDLQFQFPQNYDKELFLRYLQEIWEANFIPESIDTGRLIDHVIAKNQKQFTESLVKMFPKVHDRGQYRYGYVGFGSVLHAGPGDAQAKFRL
jgi:hypothetical protein